MLIFLGAIKVTADTSQVHGVPRVLQRPENMTLRSNLSDSNDSDIVHKPLMWPSSLDEDKNDDSCQRRLGSDNCMQINRHEPTYKDMLCGFRPFGGMRGFGKHFIEQISTGTSPLKNHFQDQEGSINLCLDQYSLMPSNSPFNIVSTLRMRTHASELPYQKAQNVTYGGLEDYSLVQGHRVEQNLPNWPGHLQSTSQSENFAHQRVVKPRSLVAAQNEITRPKESGNCKLFGFHLDSSPAPSDHVVRSEHLMRRPNATNDIVLHAQPTVAQNQSQALDGDDHSKFLNGTKSVTTAPAATEREMYHQRCPQTAKEVQSKLQGGSSRSCTKVFSHYLCFIHTECTNFFYVCIYLHIFVSLLCFFWCYFFESHTSLVKDCW